MRTIKCDLCDRQIDSGLEGYYSIEEITYSEPRSDHSRLITQIDRDQDFTLQDRTESWAIYHNIDFCTECFWKPELESLRNIIQKRISGGGEF